MITYLIYIYQITVTHPAPICKKLPLLPLAEACVDLDLNELSTGEFSICANAIITFKRRVIFHRQIACFKMPI